MVAMMCAPLKDLKDQAEELSPWRRSIYVVINGQNWHMSHNLIACNQSLFKNAEGRALKQSLENGHSTLGKFPESW